MARIHARVLASKEEELKQLLVLMTFVAPTFSLATGAVIERALNVIATGAAEVLEFQISDENAWDVGLASAAAELFWVLLGATAQLCGWRGAI